MPTKIIRNLRGLVTFSACTVNTVVFVLPLMLLAVVKLLIPVAAVRRVITRGLMSIGEAWIATNAMIFRVVNDTTWDVRGIEGLRRDQWYLVMANHQTWVDIVALQTIFNRRIPFLKFFIKQELIWFPLLGMAWWALDMPFMKRYSKSYLARHPEKKGKDLEATRKACEKFRHVPTSVINFVEGTRFSEEKRDRRGSPYRHLLQPRAGGVALALSSMGDMFDAIVDVTIAYPAGVPKFWDMMCGELEHVAIDVRQQPVDRWLIQGDYETDRDFRRDFHQWLGGLWEEKDATVATLNAAAPAGCSDRISG